MQIRGQGRQPEPRPGAKQKAGGRETQTPENISHISLGTVR